MKRSSRLRKIFKERPCRSAKMCDCAPRVFPATAIKPLGEQDRALQATEFL